jgi:ADP-heptose:LPS heptosyltransferase
MPWLERILGKEVLAPNQIDLSEIGRILVIRQHDMLGDFLLATPVLRALRQRMPLARIGVVVREYFAGVVKHHPFVDEALIFYEHGSRWTPKRVYDFWKQLRQRWDLVIVLSTVSHSFTSDLLGFFSGARYILGSADRIFPGCSRNFFYNLIAPYDKKEKHQSERNLDIVRYLGIDTGDVSEAMQVLEMEKESARRKLTNLGWRNHRPVIGMHVGAGKIRNRWPVRRFAELAQRLHDDHGAQIVLFWGANEGELSRQFCERIDFAPIKVEPAGLRELAACLAHCDMLVCNDTGVMHLCAAVGVPLVAIFGPTDPREWKPIGNDFVAVRGARGNVENLDVDEVFAALVSAFGARLNFRRFAAAKV